MEHTLSHCTFNILPKSLAHSVLLKVFLSSLFLISAVGNDTFAQITETFTHSNYAYGIVKNSSNNYGPQANELYVGYDSWNSEVNRGYIEFDISSVPGEATITEASINIKYSHSIGTNANNNTGGTIQLKNLDWRPTNFIFSDDWELLYGKSIAFSKTIEWYDTDIAISGAPLVNKIQEKVNQGEMYLYYGVINSAENSNGLSFSTNQTDLYLSVTYTIPEPEPEPEPTAPQAPSNLVANSITATGCNITWAASLGDGIGYKIYQNGVYLKDVTSTTTAIGDLTANTTYTFAVSAYNSVGESPKSNVVSVTTLPLPPSVPNNLTATNIKATECSLAWNESSGIVEGYRIYQNGTQVKTTTSTSLTIDDLSQGTNYVFEVSAYNSGGESAKSAGVSVTTGILPMAPTNFQIWYHINAGYILTWNPSNGGPPLEGYKIYQHSPAGEVVASTTSTSYELNKLNLTPGLIYIYSVAAFNQYGESAKSNADGIMVKPIPGTPLNLTVNDITDTKCTLTWTESSGTVDHYNIYRNGVKVKAVSSAGTTIEGLSPGTSYTFTVRAYNASGESDSSNEVVANTLPMVAPSNLVATNITSIRCSLAWTAAIGTITGYHIYQDGLKIKTTTSTSATIENLSGNSTYTFKVSAYHGLYESDLSNAVEVNTPLLEEPAAPVNLIAENISSNSCNLSWGGASGIVTGYHVYQNGIKIKTLPSTSTSINGLNPGTSYSFQVSAYNDAGESPLSYAKIVQTTPVTTPSTPSAFRISSRGSNYCTLSWNAPLGVVTGYYVYLMVGNVIIAKSATTEKSYNYTNLNGSFNFAVSAYNDVGESPRSYNISFQGPNSSFTASNDINSFMISKQRDDELLVQGEKIVVLPNPATNTLFIEGPVDSNVLIFDLSGKLLSQKRVTEGRVDISHLEPGTYIIQIETEKGIITKKIVKQ